MRRPLGPNLVFTWIKKSKTREPHRSPVQRFLATKKLEQNYQFISSLFKEIFKGTVKLLLSLKTVG